MAEARPKIVEKERARLTELQGELARFGKHLAGGVKGQRGRRVVTVDSVAPDLNRRKRTRSHAVSPRIAFFVALLWLRLGGLTGAQVVRSTFGANAESWRVDAMTGRPSTKADMMAVLGNLTGLFIRTE